MLLNQSYTSYRRGLLFFIPTCIAVLALFQFDAPPIGTNYFLLTIFLSGLADAGGTKINLLKDYALFAVGATIICSIATLLHYNLSGYPYYISLVALLFASQFITVFFQSTIRTMVIVGIFPIVLADFPLEHSDLMTNITAHNIAILLGSTLTLLISVALPKVQKALASRINPSLLMIKHFRVCMAVGVIFILCHFWELAHPSWAAISAFVCAELNMGNSIRKSAYRITGTLLGICLGLPLSYYVFEPLPTSRYLVIVLLSFALVLLERSYMLTIFFATLSLGGLYFAIDPVANNVTYFILDRMLETAMGLTVFIAMEIVILPKSVLTAIQKDSSVFWNYMTQATISSDASNKIIALENAKQTLNKLNEAIESYRYEPLVLMTRKYFYCKKQIKLYKEVYELYNNCKKDCTEPELTQIFNQLSVQTLLPFDERKAFINQLFNNINIETYENNIDIQNKIKRVIANIHTTLSKRSHYFN